jgi:hypothetical protein
MARRLKRRLQTRKPILLDKKRPSPRRFPLAFLKRSAFSLSAALRPAIACRLSRATFAAWVG